METRRVLVVGIVLAEAENLAASIVDNFAGTRTWTVDQRWVAIGSTPNIFPTLPIVETFSGREAKFSILNRILSTASLEDYNYIVVSDDDIELPPDFLDHYLDLVERYDFALAQPARSHDSYIDHPFVEQLDGIVARQTRFVEIGPLFSIRADAIKLLLPFNVTSPMGWGYDLTWPVTLASAQLRMGIVDAVPVAHKLRKAVSGYDRVNVNKQMEAYLSSHVSYGMGVRSDLAGYNSVCPVTNGYCRCCSSRP